MAVRGGVVETFLEGPPNPLRVAGEKLRCPIRVELSSAAARLKVNGTTHELKPGEYTPWIALGFPMGLGLKLKGICKFRLLSTRPEFRLYASPINIDPVSPVMPISHPNIFSVFLAKLCGRFATLGLAEDTWAVNEGVLDDDAFLEQAWTFHAEREAMLEAMIDRTRQGVVCCVFDGTDRIQHMFTRFVDDDHPAVKNELDRVRYHRVIEDTYVKADASVGKALAKLDLDDDSNLVLVLSDHGFKSFRRGVNLNAWLWKNGYLTLDKGRSSSGAWLEGVDWSQTRAYALGLGGIFINVRGRERCGIVAREEAAALAGEIADRLNQLIDPATGEQAIRHAEPTRLLYQGPYIENAPEILVGYNVPCRASWDGAKGVVSDIVFSDNTKAWSGDHCIDPELVPGVLFSSRPLPGAEKTPSIVDIAPTLLDLFGITPPRHMDGKSLVS